MFDGASDGREILDPGTEIYMPSMNHSIDGTHSWPFSNVLIQTGYSTPDLPAGWTWRKRALGRPPSHLGVGIAIRQVYPARATTFPARTKNAQTYVHE